MFKHLIDVAYKEGTEVSAFTFSLSEKVLNAEKVRLGDYLYSMNAFIHFSDDQIDLFDNPYFEVKSYVMDDNKNYYGRVPANDSELHLIKCPFEELKKYLGDNAPFFKNSVCFNNTD